MKLPRFDDLPMVFKIGVAPALALMALALVTAAALWTQQAQSAAIKLVAEKDMAISLQLAGISKRIAVVHGEVYVLLTQQAAQLDAAAAQTRIDAIGKETDGIKADLTKLKAVLPAQQQKALAAVEKDLSDYHGAIDVVGSMLGVDFRTAQAFVAPFEAYYTRMIAAVDKAVDDIQLNAKAEATKSASTASMVGLYTALGSGLTLVLVGLVAFAAVLGTRNAVERIAGATESLARGDAGLDLTALARKDELGAVVRSLDIFRANQLRIEALRRDQETSQAREASTRAETDRVRAQTAEAQAVMVKAIALGLSRLSRGDLTHRLTEPFSPEYEELRADFNAAVDQLQQTLRVIARTTAGIGSSTQEIAAASGDLSHRTEQQAASLQQTAAALGEITSAVKSSASHARQASEVVSKARNEALDSDRVVNEAVAAMGKIEASSRQISQIVGVIDEIAFQTNLLALNAGVEAARAGDSGRGFAVVAQEVRGLAQRSAEAAREIKSLISASTGNVNAGVALVGQAGSALQDIIGKVAEIDRLIVAITTNADAQASGIGDINLAFNQIDQMTQQNAGMAEQSTAATQVLEGQTAELSRLVAEFKIGVEQVAALEARRPRATPVPTLTPSPTARAVLRRAAAAGAASAAVGESWEEF